jgi:hypothetical protein
MWDVDTIAAFAVETDGRRIVSLEVRSLGNDVCNETKNVPCGNIELLLLLVTVMTLVGCHRYEVGRYVFNILDL